MNLLQTVDSFPPITRTISASEPLRCMCPRTTKGQPCRKPISKTDREKISIIDRKLLKCSSAKDALPLVEDRILLCLCKGLNGHSEQIERIPLRKELIQKWMGELGFGVVDSSLPKVESNMSPRSCPSTTPPVEKYNTPASNPEAAPRYNLRPGGEGEANSYRGLTDKSSRDILEFEPFKQATKKQLYDVLLEDLPPENSMKMTNDNWATGTLYGLSRKGCANMLKIGYSKHLKARIESIVHKCGWRPEVRLRFDNVPHLRRAERLVHYELLQYWRKEKHPCRFCGARHQEWFAVSEADAMEVMGNVARWLTVAKPFQENGQLKPEWRIVIQRMRREGVEVTSAKLLDAHYGSGVSEKVSRPEERTAPRANARHSTTSSKEYPSTTSFKNYPSVVPQGRPSPAENPEVEAWVQFIQTLQPSQIQLLLDLVNVGHQRGCNLSFKSFPIAPISAA